MSLRNGGLLLAVLVAGAAKADGSATTLFDSRPYVRDGGYQESPIYEAFALNARSSGTDWLQDVRIVARGWGRVTIGAPFDGDRATGDLDSLFLEARTLQRHLQFRLGRQLALGGAVRATQLDGLSVDGLVSHGFGVQAWAGVPVQERFNESRGDFLTGARAYWRQAFDSELGVSYAYALRNGYVVRSAAAVDGSWTPLRPLTVSGLFQWSLADERLEEARLSALWQITRSLQLVADAARTAPDLFVDRSSIFWVFSEERRDEAGGEVVYRLSPAVSLDGDWHWLKLEGGHGHRGGARATFRASTGTSYGAEFRLLDEPDNGYKLARVFGIRKLPRDMTVTVDLDAYWLEHAINGEPRSVVGTITWGWAFLANWEAMLAGSLGMTPYFERRAEVIARVTYRFGMPSFLPGGFR